MRHYLFVLPLLLAGCRHSSPLTGPDAVPGAPTSGVPATPTARSEFADLTGLTFQVTGGFAGLENTLSISDGQISVMRKKPVSQQTAPFSAAEMKQLSAVLQANDFTHAVGDYHQNQLADGFNETLTVTVGTGKQAKTYTVTNYGDQAPAGYYKVTEYLSKLQETKFAPKK